jgi:hypothetical protein
MATAIKHFSGSVGSTGGTSINWINEDADLDLCLGNGRDKAKEITGLTDNHDFLSFKPDGTRIFLGTDGTTDGIVSFDLATAWDIESTLSNQKSFDYLGAISETGSNKPNFVFNDDGTQFLFVTNNGGALSYYTCSTAYDVTTASFTGNVEEFDAGQTGLNGLTWTNSGETFVVTSTAGEFQIYTASTAYDFSTLAFRNEIKSSDYNSASSLYVPVGSNMNGGLFGNDTNNVLLQAHSTTAHNNTTTRLKPLVPDSPGTMQLVDTQITVHNKIPATCQPFFTRDGEYVYWIDLGGNYTTAYSGNDWIFRAPTSHSVAADTTIYTVPTGKVAKVTMNMAGQSANVYAGGDKIAQLKGGSSIRHTQQGHVGHRARSYVSNEANPNTFAIRQTPTTTFYARGGTPLNMGVYEENQGPDFFMLAAGESLVLKNSVNVNFDIQVIEDNASS